MTELVNRSSAQRTTPLKWLKQDFLQTVLCCIRILQQTLVTKYLMNIHRMQSPEQCIFIIPVEIQSVRVVGLFLRGSVDDRNARNRTFLTEHNLINFTRTQDKK